MWFTWLPYAAMVPPSEYTQTPVVLQPFADRATLRTELQSLTTLALEEAWSCTDDELAREVSSGRRAALVTMRALILDEVERRSRRRYRRWLRRGGPHVHHTQPPCVVLR